MGYFDGIDLEKLFDSESTYGKELTFGPVTDELIGRAEKAMGYRIPASYRELLEYRNGGAISDELDKSWLSAIYGISPEPENWNGLEAMFDNWKNEWQYPDIGIPFGETQSAGHDMYYMDFRATDEDGEPRIVRIDNESDNEARFVAENLADFIRLILRNEEIRERPLDDGTTAAEQQKNSDPEEWRITGVRISSKESADVFFGQRCVRIPGTVMATYFLANPYCMFWLANEKDRAFWPWDLPEERRKDRLTEAEKAAVIAAVNEYYLHRKDKILFLTRETEDRARELADRIRAKKMSRLRAAAVLKKEVPGFPRWFYRDLITDALNAVTWYTQPPASGDEG